MNSLVPHQKMKVVYSPGVPPWEEIDPGILEIVRVLHANGVETCQSCQGGPGHPYEYPTVEFFGHHAEAWRALCVAQWHGLPVRELRCSYAVMDGEVVGPQWALVFAFKAKPAAPGWRTWRKKSAPAKASRKRGRR